MTPGTPKHWFYPTYQPNHLKAILLTTNSFIFQNQDVKCASDFQM